MAQKQYRIIEDEKGYLQKLKNVQEHALTAIERVLYAFADTDEEELTEAQLEAIEQLYDAYAKIIEI